MPLTGTSGDDVYVIYDPPGSGPDTIDMGGGADLVILNSSPAGGLTITNTEIITFGYDFQSLRTFGPITIQNFDLLNGFVVMEAFAYATMLGSGWPGNVSPFEYGLMRLVQVGDDTVLQVDYAGTGEFADVITFENILASDLRSFNFFRNGWTIETPDAGWTLNGTSESEVLFGTIDSDVLDGAGGDDILGGGYGFDVLTGGAGSDVFRFSRNIYHRDPASRATVTDFNAAEDRLDLRDYGYLYFNDILSRAYQDGANVIIEFAPQERVTLQNVQLSSLTADNFIGILPGGGIAVLPPPETSDPTIRLTQTIGANLELGPGEFVFSYVYGGLFRVANGDSTLHQVTNAGTVWVSGETAIYAFEFYDGWGNSLPGSITNSGYVYAVGDAYSAIAHGDLFEIVNTGVMAAVSWTDEAIGLEGGFSGIKLTNSGTISVRGGTDLRASIALSLWTGLSDGFIHNEATGKILIEAPDAIAIYIDGAYSPVNEPNIVNKGLIEAVSLSDIPSVAFYSAPAPFSVLDILNSGTIKADIAILIGMPSYDWFKPAARITNAAGGQIFGDMYFADGNDIFTNSGLLTGDLYSDAGNDRVDTTDGRIEGFVDLGDGQDEYLGGAFGDNVAGGVGVDTLAGGDGDDTLDGGLGADAMDGGAGNDTFYVDDAGDVIVDVGGRDLVMSLLSYNLGAGLEDLALLGAEALNAKGNDLDNVLIGNSGSNKLSGGIGNDSLFGDQGQDFLTGGAGSDRFYFDVDPSTGADTIADFSAGDAIYLDVSAFRALTPGALTASAFAAGTVATTAAHRIIYDSATGSIFYDADGNGSGQAILFAKVTAGTLLTASDFTVYGTLLSVESATSITLAPDKLILTLTGSNAANGTGNAFDNDLYGNGAANLLSGLDGADWLYAGDGNDTLLGGSGADLLVGEAGDDTLEGGDGDDWIDGGSGFDTISYASSTRAVEITLGLDGRQNTLGAGKDYFVGVEAIAGSAFDDVLTGDEFDNRLSGGSGLDWLEGGRGSDILDGGAGIDTASYNSSWYGVNVSLAVAGPQLVEPFQTETLISIENLVGSLSGDKLTGNALANSLIGQAGDDILEGGLGNDALNGGVGVDTASYASAPGGVTVSLMSTGAHNTGNAGIDTYYSIENLAGSAFADSLTGDDFDNRLTGNAGGDILVGNKGDDWLAGGDGADNLNGGTGNDTVDGGKGADAMAGGAGDDQYFVDDAADLISEAAAQGTDWVHIVVDYTLAANLENLAIGTSDAVVPNAPINGTGNGLDNVMQGSFTNNILSGLDGNDAIWGGEGDDTLIGGNGNDVLEGWYGADVLMGGAGNDRLVGFSGMDIASYADATSGVAVSLSIGGAQNTGAAGIDTLVDIIGLRGSNYSDRLTGNGSHSFLYGGDGNDVLVDTLGGGGMDGESGSDIYLVSSSAVHVAGEIADTGSSGIDEVRFSATGTAQMLKLFAGDTGIDRIVIGTGTDAVAHTSGSLAHDVDARLLGYGISILGNSGANKVLGTGFDDHLEGGAGGDRLLGYDGDDVLDGGKQVDSLVGGLGDDTYIVDSNADATLELVGEGTDTVVASVAVTLRANIENLVQSGVLGINGTGNALDNVMEGNVATNRLFGLEGSDTLIGNEGNDQLDGGAGADTLIGGVGNDLYFVDSAADTVTELAGEGRDTVRATASYTLSAEVEWLELQGSTNLDGTGNGLANVLRGNDGDNGLFGLGDADKIYAGAGNDSVDGGEGNDVLEGGTGSDEFTGGAGVDRFLFREGDFGGATLATADVIHDFSHAEGDKIHLSTVDANSTLAGNQAFAFLGTGAFTNTAGQLRYEQVDGNTFVQGDIDGDGVADFVIQVDGSVNLVSGDFVL